MAQAGIHGIVGMAVRKWSRLMLPAKFLCFALFFVSLAVAARKRGTDGGFLRTLRLWTVAQGVLFAVFAALVYTMEKGFIMPYRALYLLPLGLAFGVTIRMRETVEAVVQAN